MTPRTESFFQRDAVTAHEGGKAGRRPRVPMLRRLVMLGAIGFMSLGLLAASPQQAQAYTYVNTSSVAASTAATSAAAASAAKKRREARALGVARSDLYTAREAAHIQAREQGYNRWSYGLRNSMEIDQPRIQAYVEARNYESHQRVIAQTPEEKWKFDSWQDQARDQGLNGWSDDGFTEDRTRTRADIQQSREDHERTIEALKWIGGGLGGLGLLWAGGTVGANRRRENARRGGYRR